LCVGFRGVFWTNEAQHIDTSAEAIWFAPASACLMRSDLSVCFRPGPKTLSVWSSDPEESHSLWVQLAGRSMPIVGAHAAIWIPVFLVGVSLAGRLLRRSGAVGESRGSSNYSVASGWPPGGCRRWREGRRATENGGDGNISPACDRRFRPGEPRSLSGWSVA
jgi:hypothetical protein